MLFTQEKVDDTASACDDEVSGSLGTLPRWGELAGAGGVYGFPSPGGSWSEPSLRLLRTL